MKSKEYKFRKNEREIKSNEKYSLPIKPSRRQFPENNQFTGKLSIGDPFYKATLASEYSKYSPLNHKSINDVEVNL